MLIRLTGVGGIVAATVLTAVAAATPASSGQRIAITDVTGNASAFVLTPLTAGPIGRDSGRASACCWSRNFITRDGQAIEIDAPVVRTFVGKRGTFVWRASIEWIDAGNGYEIGTGTWKIVHGTGAYAHLEGQGHVALSQPPSGLGSARAEGLVDLGR